MRRWLLPAWHCRAVPLQLQYRGWAGHGLRGWGSPCHPPHRPGHSLPAAPLCCAHSLSFPLLFVSDFSACCVPPLILSPFPPCYLLPSCCPAVSGAPGTSQPRSAHCVIAVPRHWQTILKGLSEPLTSPASCCCSAHSLFCTHCRCCTATETKKNQLFVRGRHWTINEMITKLSSVSSCKYSNSFNFLIPKTLACESPRTNHHN